MLTSCVHPSELGLGCVFTHRWITLVVGVNASFLKFIQVFPRTSNETTLNQTHTIKIGFYCHHQAPLPPLPFAKCARSDKISSLSLPVSLLCLSGNNGSCGQIAMATGADVRGFSCRMGRERLTFAFKKEKIKSREIAVMGVEL